MSEVTIRGVVATSVLDRGSEVTVERTDVVESLIADGYVEVLGDGEVVTTSRDDDGDGQPDLAVVPKANATLAEWKEFADRVGLAYDDDVKRQDLIEAYQGRVESDAQKLADQQSAADEGTDDPDEADGGS